MPSRLSILAVIRNQNSMYFYLPYSPNMQTAKIKFQTVDEYINSFPGDVQGTLENIRQTIQQAAPEAKEVISYQMPAYLYHGVLIYFAAFKNHYSLFIPHALKVCEAFKKELVVFEIHKATFKFPNDKPFPLELLGEIARFRVKENLDTNK